MTSTTVSPRPRSPWRYVLAVSLLVGGIGIFIQYLTGVPGFPVVPPGPIILVVAAAIVAFVRWRWIPILGLLAGLFILVGFLAAGAGDRLITPSAIGPFLGTWMQLAGVVVAVIAGVVCLVLAARRRPV